MNSSDMQSKKKLLRQIITAWITLLFGSLLFSLIAVLVSTITGDNQLAVLSSTIIIIPLIFGVHLTLYKHNYKIFTITKRSTNKSIKKIKSHREISFTEHLPETYLIPASASYVDKVESWLKYMGIDTVQRDGNINLEVKLRTSNHPGVKYTLHFNFLHENILIESLVFKGVSGKPTKVELFQKALLGYNSTAAIEGVAFAYIPLRNDEYGIVLQTSLNYSSLTIETIKKTLDAYNIAYTTFIPRLNEIINELGLKFDGKESDLRTMLKDQQDKFGNKFQ